MGRRGKKGSKAYWILALGVGLLTLTPARATIIQSGPTPQADLLLEAEAHAAGAKHACVVGLARPASASAWATVATGVYLGTSNDGRRGLVLSVAHPFQHLPAKVPHGSLSVLFSPQNADAPGLVPVARVHVHPQAGCAPDLAILEFDASRHQARLAQAGILPAVLEEGPASTVPLMEAEIAGFGRLGRNARPTLGEAGRIHGGHTRVTYGRCLGHWGFHHWSPLAEEAFEAALSQGRMGNRYPFLTDAPATHGFLPGSCRPIPLGSHLKLALFAPGDQGGPLIFPTASGPKVAGIASRTRFRHLELPKTHSRFFEVLRFDFQLFAVQSWEPVMDHLGWIREVQAGPGEVELLEVDSAQRTDDLMNYRHQFP